MSNTDYKIENLTKIVTTIGEFSTELTVLELEEKKELAIENSKTFDFPSLIQEFSFGNRLNHCIETIKLDLKEVKILGYKAMTEIKPKLNERATLEAIKERDEKQEARLLEINNQKKQSLNIQRLEKSVEQLEIDKKEKELQYKEIELSGDIDELDTKLDI